MRLAAAFAFMALFAASPAFAGELRCWNPATGGVACNDGSRAHTFAGVTTIKRPARRDVRCARTATGLSCNER